MSDFIPISSCILASVLVSIADFFAAHTDNPRSLYLQSALIGVGVLAAFYLNGEVLLGFAFAVLIAALRLLLPLPLRLILMCIEVDYWKWWALEQMGHLIVIVLVLNIWGS